MAEPSKLCLLLDCDIEYENRLRTVIAVGHTRVNSTWLEGKDSESCPGLRSEPVYCSRWAGDMAAGAYKQRQSPHVTHRQRGAEQLELLEPRTTAADDSAREAAFHAACREDGFSFFPNRVAVDCNF